MLDNHHICRKENIAAYIDGDLEHSLRDTFELHLKECAACSQEVASFGLVRESITAWRDEALSGFVSTPLAATERRKSAIAALRQFFDLSPLWLKGATAFAAVTFCVLAGLVLFRSNDAQVSSTNGAVYTANDRQPNAEAVVTSGDQGASQYRAR